jgi:hypothetical protein
VPLLCLAADPANVSAVALVEPAERPRVLLLRVIAAPTPSEWAECAVGVMREMYAAAGTRPVVGWIEMTITRAQAGANALSMRRGQLLQEAHGAGFLIDKPRHDGDRIVGPGFDLINSQTWPGILGLRAGKRGDGMHRVSEAEALVDFDPRVLRGLGKAVVDASEAILMGAAMSRRVLGLADLPKPVVAKKARASRAKAPRRKAS